MFPEAVDILRENWWFSGRWEGLEGTLMALRSFFRSPTVFAPPSVQDKGSSRDGSPMHFSTGWLLIFGGQRRPGAQAAYSFTRQSPIN